MAPKDYVKRPQAKKNNAKTRARNTRGKKASSGSDLPWLKVLISLAVVALFIFGLYRLQSLDGDDENEIVAPGEEFVIVDDGASLEEAANEELAPLPVLGEEEWEYIDTLPDYSVEVDVTGPIESDKEFIMQCGSFRTMDRAEELRAKIAFQGLESRILTSNGKNGLWYRVVLGPYERKRNAERQRHQLRNAKINGCKIW